MVVCGEREKMTGRSMITTSVDKGGDRYTKSSLASSTIALIVFRANLHYSLREGYANDSAQ
jgi:hypothetical protein